MGRGLAAVAAVAAVVLATVFLVPRDGTGPTADVASTLVLERSADVPLTASVRLEPVAWGTRIAMDCTYRAGAPGRYSDAAGEYALVVTDVEGESSQVSTWTAGPGQTVRLDAGTAVVLAEIRSVEIRSLDTGQSLLSADLPAPDG